MSLIRKVRYKLNQWFRGYILHDLDSLIALSWIKNDKQMDYRHRYELSDGAVVFDLGGHLGDWTSVILRSARIDRVYVFEVIPKYVAALHERFKSEKRVTICDFGLGAETRSSRFSVEALASSAFRVNDVSDCVVVEAPIKDVVEFMEEYGIERVDLVKINIEGGEYEFLDRLINASMIGRFNNLQIQFHNLGDWAVEARLRIRGKLSETHYLTYDYRWIFENWRLKS